MPPASQTTDGSTLTLRENLDGYGPPPTPVAGPGSGDPSFLSVRPVIRLMDGPCTPVDHGTSAILREASPDIAGEGCVEVGPVAVDARAVAGAEAKHDPGGEWWVEYTLTQEGEDRYNAMARHVGVGNRVAVVVDGVVVSAWPLEPTELSTGLKAREFVSGDFDARTARGRPTASGPAEHSSLGFAAPSSIVWRLRRAAEEEHRVRPD